MDPFLEQKLRDEVHYLHSLWHQGPAISNPNPYTTNNPIIPIYNPNTNPNRNPNIVPVFNPNHNPIPNPNFNFNPYPYVSRHLQPSKPTQFKNEKQLKPSNSTPFKKEKRRRRDKRGGINRGKDWAPGSDPSPVLDFEWPCDPDLPDTRCGWPTLDLKPAPRTRVATAEEQSRIFATRLQQKALKAAQELFASNMDSDGDDNDEYGEHDDDDIMDDDGGDEYKFFLKVFMEDSELRSYYEKNYESGEFCCLVCGGIGQKVGKRFKNCVALVQHSLTITKTKKRQAHRAFVQAICKVLGWDIDKLPTIVLPKLGDSQGNAPDGPDHGKENLHICNSVNVDNIELVLNKNDNAGEVLPDEAVDLSNVVGGELMFCEHSLMVANGNKNMEDPDKGLPSNAEGNEEGVVNCLEPYKEDGVGDAGNEVKDNRTDNVATDLQKANKENQC